LRRVMRFFFVVSSVTFRKQPVDVVQRVGNAPELLVG
jgi:hypothetical protein